MLSCGPIYSEKSQGKEDKEGQKERPDHLEEGSEAELTGELIWQPGSDAVKLCLVCNTKLHFTAVSSGKLHTADVGEEKAKKTQNLGLSDVQRCARARIGFFALSLIDLSLGIALSLQALCPVDKTTYNISQSLACQ